MYPVKRELLRMSVIRRRALRPRLSSGALTMLQRLVRDPVRPLGTADEIIRRLEMQPRAVFLALADLSAAGLLGVAHQQVSITPAGYELAARHGAYPAHGGRRSA
jgi:hypothetical protein